MIVAKQEVSKVVGTTFLAALSLSIPASVCPLDAFSAFHTYYGIALSPIVIKWSFTLRYKLKNNKISRCEFCGLSTSGCQDICQGEGHTIKCYNENRDTIDNFQDSDLYLCKRCQKCFKIWPKDLLNPKSECSKCNIKFRDDVQSQAHVCFTCQDYTIYNHLCQHHNFDESSEIIVVDFNDLDSIPANPEPIFHV